MQRDKRGADESNWYALLVVMSGVFLSTMDSGMVNIALPTLMRHFALSMGDVEKVVTLYLLTITISLVFWGRLADRLGLERIYLGGVIVFSLGAFCCYFSTNISYLLFARVFQGCGAAMMMSSGPAIIKGSFPEGVLGRSLGLVGIATACGLLSGPFISGQLLTYFDYHAIFLVSALLSFVVAGCGMALFFQRLLRPERGKKHKFDWAGGVCWVGLVVMILHILQNYHNDTIAITAVKTIFLLLLISLFFAIERRAIHPILPVKSFLRRYYWIGVVTAGLSFASLFSVLILLPFYLDYIRQMASREIGIVMMAVPATLILLSPAAGYLYDKIGARFLTSTGLAISCISLLGLSGLTAASPYWLVITILAAVGAGQSIFLSPNSASVLSKVAQHRLGVTAGILATARNMGMVTGAAFATLIFTLFSSGSGTISPAQVDLLSDDQFLYAFRMTFRCMAGISLIAALLSTLRK